MLTNKPVSISSSGNSATDIVRQISLTEKKYQEDLNRAFTNLNEGAFKGLRRQLPVTRQKVEWEKISGYRVSHSQCYISLFSLTHESLVKILVVEDHGKRVNTDTVDTTVQSASSWRHEMNKYDPRWFGN